MWPAAIGSDVAIASAATIGLGAAMGSDVAIGSDVAMGSNRERRWRADVNRIFFSVFVSEKGGQLRCYDCEEGSGCKSPSSPIV